MVASRQTGRKQEGWAADRHVVEDETKANSPVDSNGGKDHGMSRKWQFSLRYLLIVTTAIALTMALPAAYVSGPSVVFVGQVLLCATALGAAVGGWFCRTGDGALAGVFSWELMLIVLLAALPR